MRGCTSPRTRRPPLTDLDQLFDEAAGDDVLRDRYDRPLLIPSAKRKRRPLVQLARGDEKRFPGRLPYTRASSLSNYVTDKSGLERWRMRSLTKGLGEREDLAAQAAGLPPILGNQRDESTLSKAEKEQDRRTKKALDGLAEEAMIYANRDYKANWGTAVHGFTDPGPHGDVPARMQSDVESWFQTITGWQIHATEIFVANEEYQAAGTFDHLVSIPWLPELGRVVVDKKTGKLKPHEFSVQLPTYARGVPYDVAADQRADWPDGIAPSRKWGIIAHIPMGLGRTDLYLVDLELGHKHALTAVQARTDRTKKQVMKGFDPLAERRLQWAGLVDGASTRDELRSIRREALTERTWSMALEELCTNKGRELPDVAA